MPAPRSHRRARLAVLASAAMALTGLQLFAPPPANAAGSTGLVIKEVYGAGGNTGATYNADFVELYNPQGTAQSMNGLSVQYRSAGGGVGGTQALPNKSVPPGGYFLIQMSSTGSFGAPLPAVDLVATSPIAMAAGGGQVILGTASTYGTGNLAGAPTVTDMVGQSAATSFETTAASVAGNATNSLNRAGNGADTNSNIADFSLAAPSPTAGLGAVNPGVKRVVVNTPVSFSLTGFGGTPPYSWSITELPIGLSATDNTISGTPTSVGSSTVNVTITDSAASPGSASMSFTLKVNPAADATNTIAEIQATGDETPFFDQSVTTEGVVTAAFPTGGLNGFYIQTPGADTANASDAIFVYGGTGGFTTYPAIGDSVDVTGTAGEFSGQTQITTTDAGVTPHGSALGTVTPKTVVPGTDCALPGTTCLAGAALDAEREVAEGEAFQPTAPWTATDVYDGSPYNPASAFTSAMYGEIGVAAESDQPLVSPTEVIDAQSAAKADRIKYNDAHRIVLDDGSSTDYNSAANTGLPLPWYTATHFPRVGAAVTFPAPVVFTFSLSAWRILPTTQVVGAPTGTQPQLSQTRGANLAPQDVGGDIKLATFNVLNFFPTTGEEFVGMGGGRTCSYFNDRAGNRITNDTCAPNGPRGAANDANLVRQRNKIVAAINTADADIVSLEELENSVQFGKPRDFAINALVTALNADAGAGTWAAVPSPPPSGLPPLAEQDVIRSGFIYQPANVAPVGRSVVLADESTGTEAFADAREPLAQAFKAKGGANSDAFAVIVNHFKSKGSGTPDPDGQGNADDRRELQATSLVNFANQFKTLRGITRVFLAGDFNAYTQEDPIQILNAAGYTNLESTSDPNEESYNFDGQVGSLDHVLANAAALADVEDVDIWPINGHESVYYEYSRYNYNATNLYQPGPFKSSDHNPELVGINIPAEPATRDIQILGTNDFHGRLVRETGGPSGGAAVLAGAVNQLRTANPNTVFAAAGDLIGASTFESFIAHDKPTIDALNSAGLDVSAAGNHEFDQGYSDLVNRVMAPYDATNNPYGGANWEYIAANVRKNVDDTHALAPTWTESFGSVKVGFIGAVTEHLPELVSPGGISTIHVTDIVSEVNAAASDLAAADADVIVLLVHEGAPNTDCDTMDDDPTSDFGSIITGVNANVDAIVSGHTHLAYDCSFPVPAWTGRPVTERPVVSAGQYGSFLNQLVFTVDTATGQVQAKTQELLNLQHCTTNCAPGQSGPVWVADYPADPPTADIVAAAVTAAGPLGAVELGKVGGPFKRGFVTTATSGSNENRGAESTLGNLVAEVQKWATRAPESGAAQIAFMNPGGLRTNMLGNGASSDPYPRTLTYKQAADVQPFANTLVNMDLTGAQIKTVLEQQWQPSAASRPFLKLGISRGFTYTFDDTKPAGSRITGMWLDGSPIVPATAYSVTVNSFLSTGGDGFFELANGANKQDTGKTDLQGMVDYMAEFGTSPDVVQVDSRQTGVGITFAAGEPASYKPGDHVKFDVSSFSMSNPDDLKDTEIVVKSGTTTLGTFPLDNTPQLALPGLDIVGKASVDVVVPNDAAPGALTLNLSGATTGTTTTVAVPIIKGNSSVSAPDRAVQYGQAVAVPVTVTGTGVTPTGTVELLDGTTSLGAAALDGGAATVTVPRLAVAPGTHTITVRYLGDGSHDPAESTMTLTVAQSASSVAADVTPDKPQVGKKVKLQVTVQGDNGVAPTGQVTAIIKGGTAVTVTLVNGAATINLGKFDKAGKKMVTVQYLGSVGLDVSQTVVTFKVKKKKKR